MDSPDGEDEGGFVDYFVVCGLDALDGVEPNALTVDSTENLHPLHRGYKSRVLSHYPETVQFNPFDREAVNLLCMPKGLTFCTQHQDRTPKFHSFVITREDRTQVYGAALTFYELVTDEKLCQQFNHIQGKFSQETLTRKVSTGDIPSGVVLESVSPKQGRRYSPRHQGRRSSSPAIQGMNSPRYRRKGSPAHVNSQKANTLPRTKSLGTPVRHYDISKDALFVSKCICTIQREPLVRPCQQFLEQIFDIIRIRDPSTLPLECYIYNILYEVPLPPPGKSLKFYGPLRSITCQRPSLWELPLCDYPMREMFELLGPENVLELLTCAFLEKQILLLSKDYQRLMLVAECLTALLFPFRWMHVYVPIVPASMLHFLDAPFSFIMGLHLEEEEEEFELPNQASMCYIDIDTQTAEYPEDLPLFPQRDYLLHELMELMQMFGVQITDMDTNSNTLPNASSRNIYDLGRPRHESTLVGSPGQGYSLEGSLEGDVDSSYSSSPSGGESPIPMLPSRMEILQNNEVVSKVAAIAQRTGVIQSITEIHRGEDRQTDGRNSRNYVDDIVFDCAIRETVLGHLVSLLKHYQRFVIHPKEPNLESWFTNREHMHNYDKASFLSDQPEAYLPFLSSFLESQMFATFIDNKIISVFEEKDQALEIFDHRIGECPSSAPQTPTDGSSIYITEAETMIRRRARNINYAPPEPHQLPLINPSTCHIPGFFPKLDSTLLEKKPFTNGRTRHCRANEWKKNERLRQSEDHRLPHEERMMYIQQSRSPSVKNSVLSNFDMNQANMNFVQELLKECKVKTKKMLVFKMGQEAVELGHGDVNRSGVEENTLIASLCDFLERIFSHRIHRKQSAKASFQGKSALWSFLVAFRRFRTKKQSSSEQNLYSLDRPVHTQRRSSMITDQLLQPLPSDIMYDMRNVERMSEIKTDVGRARAFVRLSLERKLLHNHLRELVSTQELCKRRYKRYAFLRAEEEKEQFLYYLLSLNAVDHTCFTNSFINTVMTYRVLIIQSRKFQTPLTANPWLCASGEIATTKLIPIPKNNQGFLFQHHNLGMLTTVRIGHDNAGFLPRWLVDYVVIRNEITGHTYKFPCGKWIGKGVDDGSLERLLVGELLPLCQDLEHDFGRGSQTLPNRKKSTTLPRPSQTSGIKLDQSVIQEKLTDAVNNIVKHFYKSDKERGPFTPLLCGEDGLVHCLQMVLQYGFKSSRLFQKNFYIWDFLEKVKRYLDVLDESEEGHLSSQQEKKARKTFCSTLELITHHGKTMGKDGKFQMLVCIGIRNHLLYQWLPILAETTVAKNMYEDYSFFNNPIALDSVVNLLMQLEEFDIVLESSITKGVDI